MDILSLHRRELLRRRVRGATITHHLLEPRGGAFLLHEDERAPRRAVQSLGDQPQLVSLVGRGAHKVLRDALDCGTDAAHGNPRVAGERQFREGEEEKEQVEERKWKQVGDGEGRKRDVPQKMRESVGEKAAT